MKKYKRLHDFYLGEGDGKILKYILPEVYIEENLHKKNFESGYALRFLQNGLHEILNSFLNGGFSAKGYLLHPLIKDVSTGNIIKIRRLHKVAEFLGKNGYGFYRNAGKNYARMGSRNFASLLSDLYWYFSAIKPGKTASIEKPECRELEFDDYKKEDAGYLEPLKDLKDYSVKNLNKYLAGFYLHGSLATNDYIKGWSDIDTLSVVSGETLSDTQKLLELRDELYHLRRFFYRMEPLQHHGTIIITEHDFDNYCHAYFPVHLFKYAKSFFPNDKKISLRLRDCKLECYERMFWFVHYFRKLCAGKKFNMGSYDTKVLLHSVTLFPSLYLQAKGRIYYKKYSFDIARKDFKKPEWAIIDEISSVRMNWKNPGTLPLAGQFSRINPLLAYQLNSRIIDLFCDAKKTNSIYIENIANNMLRLSENAWRMVKEDAKRRKL